MIVGIVPAAGMGTRMKMEKNKLLLSLRGKPILLWTLKALEDCKLDHLILSVRAEELEEIEGLLEKENYSFSHQLVIGGKERQDSILNGLKELPESCEMVVVHDGARPFLDSGTYERVLQEARQVGAAVAAVPVKDTVKRADENNAVAETYDRSKLWLIQTPQIFSKETIKKAYTFAEQVGYRGTDDASVVEKFGKKVSLIMGNYQNLKITTPEDLLLGEVLLKSEKDIKMRVGKGFDVHRLVEGRPCILGGVKIAHTKGLLGHSDADVLSHAISDALLGAAGLGDIGQHFPDTDAAYEGADSIELLKKVVVLIQESGWEIENIDATIMAERPKILPHRMEICMNLAKAMKIGISQVNIKATTTERLGFVGREEGIASEAIALLCRRK